MRFARFITSGGACHASVACEDRTMTGPGIVLVGLIPGAAASRTTKERFAARGYRVVAVELADGHAVDDGLAAVRSAMDGLAVDPACNGRIAVAGYGAGGCLAFLAATRLGAAAAVAFHAIGIGSRLSEASLVRVPLSFHFGDDDERVPAAEVRSIKGALEGFATAEIYRYPGAGQGFALAGSPGYHAAVAEQAERRAFEVLDRLRSPLGAA
jgi:carboxymethylenebutenolidase